MAHVVLFFADWCGFCKRFKAQQGPWNKIKEQLTSRGVTFEEIDVGKQAAKHKWMSPETSGIPQIAIVQPSGTIKWHIGYTENPNDILQHCGDSSAPSPAGRRGSGRRTRRRSLRSQQVQGPSDSPSMHDLIWHVLEHCQHKTCMQDPVRGYHCALRCCL